MLFGFDERPVLEINRGKLVDCSGIELSDNRKIRKSEVKGCTF